MMIQKCMALVGLAVLSAAWPAQSRAEEVLTLQQALALAAANHPRMVAAEQDLKAAEGRAAGLRAWNNPELAAEYLGSPDGRQELGVSLEQQIDLPGKRGAKHAAGAAQIASAREQVNHAWSEASYETKLAYYALLLAEKRKDLAAENLTFFRKFQESVRTEYQSGQVAVSEVNRAQVELSQAENEWFLAEKELRAAKARVNQLLNRPPEEPFSPGDSLAFGERRLDFAALAKTIPENNSELKSSQRRVESSRRALELARQEAWPSPGLGVAAKRDEGGGFVGGTLRLALPLWNHNQGSKTAAEAELAKDEYAAGVLEKQLRTHLYGACADAEYAAKRVVNMKKGLEQSGGLLTQADTLYREGKTPFLAYLDTLRTVKSVKQGYYEAVADYQSKLALIDQLTNQIPSLQEVEK